MTDKLPSANSQLLRTRQTLIDMGASPASISSLLSPYRINPIGAHVDHQGGDVLAQCIDQYTCLSFCQPTATPQPSANSPDFGPDISPAITLRSLQADWSNTTHSFPIGSLDSADNWVRYAAAAAAVLNRHSTLRHSVSAVVDGTFVGAGLSSSASVVLAYLAAFAHCNGITLPPAKLVELVSAVENGHMGLNNGVQDQMSIVYGKESALSHLHMTSATVSYIDTPVASTLASTLANTMANTMASTPTSTLANEQTCWVILYSGFSRELINSGFNTRVKECQEAASALQTGAAILGGVDEQHRDEKALANIDPMLAKRAKHFFSETARVQAGAKAWAAGEWKEFGNLMNQSCHSSITQYESGSDALIDAHELASATTGVLGSRFGGGGYGGCLILLCEKKHSDAITETLLEAYLARYPDRAGIARCFSAAPVDGLTLTNE